MYVLCVNEDQDRIINLAEDIFIDLIEGRFVNIIKRFEYIPYKIGNGVGKRPDISFQAALDIGKVAEDLYSRTKVLKLCYNTPVIFHAGNAYHFDETTGNFLVKILDIVSRLGIGQFWILSETLMWDGRIKSQYNGLKELFDGVGKEMTNISVNGSWGIFCSDVPDDARVAYDLLRVIRHRLAWDSQPDGGITVNFDEPHQSAICELAKIDRV